MNTLVHIVMRHGLMVAAAIVFLYGTPIEGAFVVAAAFYMKFDDIFAVLLNNRQVSVEINVGKPATEEGETK